MKLNNIIGSLGSSMFFLSFLFCGCKVTCFFYSLFKLFMNKSGIWMAPLLGLVIGASCQPEENVRPTDGGKLWWRIF